MTVPDISSLRQLRERVGALSGPDREVDMAICLYFDTGRRIGTAASGGPEWLGPDEFTASIDAALALVERLKPPRWFFSLTAPNRARHHWRADVGGCWAEAPTAPLAILLALLDAISQSQEQVT